jgi:hypothetical protein
VFKIFFLNVCSKIFEFKWLSVLKCKTSKTFTWQDGAAAIESFRIWNEIQGKRKICKASWCRAQMKLPTCQCTCVPHVCSIKMTHGSLFLVFIINLFTQMGNLLAIILSSQEHCNHRSRSWCSVTIEDNNDLIRFCLLLRTEGHA